MSRWNEEIREAGAGMRNSFFIKPKPKDTLIQVLISGNRGQVCVMKVPEVSVTGRCCGIV